MNCLRDDQMIPLWTFYVYSDAEFNGLNNGLLSKRDFDDENKG